MSTDVNSTVLAAATAALHNDAAAEEIFSGLVSGGFEVGELVVALFTLVLDVVDTASARYDVSQETILQDVALRRAARSS